MEAKDKETLESLIEKDIKIMFSERGDRQVNINYIKEELKKYYNLGAKDLADKAIKGVIVNKFGNPSVIYLSEALDIIYNSLIEITK